VPVDENDIESAARCAWKEARGELAPGMEGVLFVLRNRCGAPGFSGNLHDVIYGKNQFTSMSVPSDPEFDLKPADDDPLYEAAMRMARQILAPEATDEALSDATNGGHYYANLHEIQKDEWFYRQIVLKSALHPITAQILHHTFFA
jgi:N-acetylmuramoyl-L-alanine amidase